ncbi:MAG: hypothetical protein ACK5GN_02740 [Pseudomonadota bacterium]
MRLWSVLLLLSAALFCTRELFAEESCVYLNDSGQIVPVGSVHRLPRAARQRVVCQDKSIDDVAAPDALDVGRDTRTAEVNSDLGPIKVRWSRSIERCFATNPARLVSESAQAVNRALRNGRFTESLRYIRREWTIAFVDRNTAVGQFPLALTLGRHPGFMIPPNRIYLVTDYIAPDCADREVSDGVLLKVLLHEIGHVLEFILLGERQGPPDRERAEGFAVWFEQYSADFTMGLPKGSVRAYYESLARSARPGQRFTPDPQGYAVSGMRFQKIVERKGIAGLMGVYEIIREQQLPFEVAVERAFSLNSFGTQR